MTFNFKSKLLLTLFYFGLSLPSLHSTLHAQVSNSAAMMQINPRPGPPMRIDEQRVAAGGIHRLTGRHLTLYTDVRQRVDIDQLVAVFDAAVPQWCNYFSIDPQRAEKWHMRAFIIEEPTRFQAAGLMPADLPDFLAGYQRGHEMWIYLQPGNYYTRHLLLHEGTHGFMDWFLDGLGSPWYAEGMAEMLGLHQWKTSPESNQNELKLHYRVRNRRETDYWGRVKIIRDDFASDELLSLDEVLNIPGKAFRDVDSYAWAWAGCDFLANHELSKKAFGELFKFAKLPTLQFDARLRKTLDQDWKILERDWRLFISEADYGYEVQRCRLIPALAIAGPAGKTVFAVKADHSWQMTSLSVKKGDRLRIHSSSRFQVGATNQPWPCEPNGVTIEYYRGQPLGMLMAGVFDPTENTTIGPDAQDRLSGLLHPLAVGYDSVIEVRRNGNLCLRINESPAKMDDNQGTLEVTVEKLE